MKKILCFIFMSIVISVISINGLYGKESNGALNIDELSNQVEVKSEEDTNNSAQIMAGKNNEVGNQDKFDDVFVRQSIECIEKTDQFLLTVSVSNITPKLREKISVVVTFRNLSGHDILAQVPDWIACTGREDILDVSFLPADSMLYYNAVAVLHRPEVNIRKDEVVKTTCEFIALNAGEFEIVAGAYFDIVGNSSATKYGAQIVCNPIKIYIGEN